MQKNVASQKVLVYAYNKLTGAFVTGDSGNFTDYVSKDGAAGISGAGSFAEVGSGYYAYAPSQAETNCDLFLLIIGSGTANVEVEDVVIYTSVEDSIETKVDTIDGIVDSILVDTGTTLEGKIDVIDGIVDSILVDTATTLNDKIDVVDGIVDSILVDTGTTLNDKIDVVDGIVDSILVDTRNIYPQVDIINGIVDSILAHAVTITGASYVDGKSLTQALQIIAAAVAGRVSGAGTGTEVFLGMDDAGTTRLSVTVDTDGNRSAVTYG
jgi:hypothetical protein